MKREKEENRLIEIDRNLAVGKIFFYSTTRARLVVKRGKVCTKCYFNDKPGCTSSACIPNCLAANRKDKVSVIFSEIIESNVQEN